MDERIQRFLADNTAAAMITLKADGMPHAVRVGLALVEGRLWSSGTASRVRTAHLRRDPRATLYMQDGRAPFWWVSLECQVTILDGPEAPELSQRLFRVMQGRPAPQSLTWFGREMADAEFLQAMRSEGRLLYEFDIQRAYGMTDASGLWSVKLK